VSAEHLTDGSVRWLARAPWKTAKDAGAEGAGTPEGNPRPGEVLLVQASPRLLAIAHDTLVPMLCRAAGAPDGPLADAVRKVRRAWHAELAEFGVDMATDGQVEVVVNPPGRPSTAFSPRLGRYAGLHVDQHDGLPVGACHLARRLAVVNLGWANRYIHVLPRRTAELIRLSGCRAQADQVPSSAAVPGIFFARRPYSRVLRIRLEPGQGYVLNAQDITHDGASPASGFPDVAFLSLGSWRADTGVPHPAAVAHPP
jgi:hypothetical protein